MHAMRWMHFLTRWVRSRVKTLAKLTQNADIVVLAVKPQECHKMLAGERLFLVLCTIRHKPSATHKTSANANRPTTKCLSMYQPCPTALIKAWHGFWWIPTLQHIACICVPDLHQAISSEDGKMNDMAVLVSIMTGKPVQW